MSRIVRKTERFLVNPGAVGRAGQRCWRAPVVLVTAMVSLFLPSEAFAESLSESVQHAFEANPSLNAQRSNLQATEYNLPRAQAGMRPKIEANAEVGYKYERGRDQPGDEGFNRDMQPRSYSLGVVQPVFDGLRTRHAVKQANSQYIAAREVLRNTEQTMAFDVVRAYLDVYANRKILQLNRRQIDALDKQRKLIGKLFGFGDVTGTEVAEVKARVEGARSGLYSAEARLKGSLAAFEQVVGRQASKHLKTVRPVDRLIASTRREALDIALTQHPAIVAAKYGADAASLQVKISRADFFPTVNLSGRLAREFDQDLAGDDRLEATVFARVRIPIYLGGEVRARTSQDRAVAQQRRFEADSVRDQVVASVTTSWAELQAAKARVTAAQAQVRAAKRGLKGIRSGYSIGERSNTDVLDAVREQLAAEINKVEAKRDRALASYAVARAMGVLEIEAVTGTLSATLADPVTTTGSFAETTASNEPKLRSAKKRDIAKKRTTARKRAVAKKRQRSRAAVKKVGRHKRPTATAKKVLALRPSLQSSNANDSQSAVVARPPTLRRAFDN